MRSSDNLVSPDHPRSRGEYIPLASEGQIPRGSSPLSRGIPQARDACDQDGGIIPALAGNTAPSPARTHSRPDHPRSRGEYNHPFAGSRGCGGSSPLSRGIPGVCRIDLDVLGIIPALAGNTSINLASKALRKDHPRSRGEYFDRRTKEAYSEGSSPLSRGIPIQAARGSRTAGIIPALAGNTPIRRPMTRGSRDHPRSRGEYG